MFINVLFSGETTPRVEAERDRERFQPHFGSVPSLTRVDGENRALAGTLCKENSILREDQHGNRDTFPCIRKIFIEERYTDERKNYIT